MIKVSIIIPVYNVEKYLEICLESCISQSLNPIEIICIDDGSSDNSLSILEKYKNKYENVVVLRQSNQGAGEARNKGLEQAKGKYICFMDADDYYPTCDVLKHLYEAAEREKVTICGGNFALDIKGKIRSGIKGWFEADGKKELCELEECYYFWRFLFNAQMLKGNEITFPAYRRFQDPLFLVKAMLCAKEFYVIEEVVYIYRNSHKELHYSLEMTLDLLQGIRDVCQLAKENDLQKLYEGRLQNIFDEYKMPIYGYAYKQHAGIWALVNEINQINKKWLNSTDQGALTDEIVKKYAESCMWEHDELIRRSRMKKFVILYGAGIVGQYISEYLKSYSQNPIGFAVTQKTETESFLGQYEIKEIQEYLSYKDESLIIVTVGVQYRKDIVQNLHILGFPDVLVVDWRKLQFVKSFVM